MTQYIFDSPVGPLYLVASEKGLRGAFWKKQANSLVSKLSGDSLDVAHIRMAISQLNEYFAGQRKIFYLAYDVEGTEFQKKVWAALAAIPYGQTSTYTEIARQVKNAKAVRAVGTANGRNPLSIFVPCHRVIALNGTLAGYAGGVERKLKLLELEKNA